MICILTPLIVLHEAGHYLWARRFGVPVRRASLFFNFGVTFLKYNPATGRVALISRKRPVNLRNDSGIGMQVMGEWAWISFRLTRGYINDALVAPTGQLVPATGTLYKALFVKQLPPSTLPKWRHTEYCLGFLPFGGYVSLDPAELQRRTTTQQLLINAGGLMVNLLITLVGIAVGIIMFHNGCDSTACDLALDYAFYSFLLFGLNVLPLAGLDGGNILRNVASYFVDVEHSKGFKQLYNMLALITVFLIFGCSQFINAVYRFFGNLFYSICTGLL
ncbi:MAG: site-2 protease family protein [Muribaculaceae bacterium]